MRKTIPFDLFRQGDTLYFNILRLQELERLLNKPIMEIIEKQYMGIDFCLAGLQVGLKHNYPRANAQFFAAKIEEYMDDGKGSIDPFIVAIISAIMASGILSKATAKKTEENEEQEKNVQRTEATPSEV